MSDTHIVWFKRDLRVHDHAPLAAACASGAPILALYIFEPDLWAGPDGTARQLKFLRDSLAELRGALEERGAQLVIRVGEVIDVFTQLHRDLGIAAIHTYQEGCGGLEGRRNEAVRRWALRAGASVREQVASALLDCQSTQQDWRNRWHAHMSAPRRLAPELINAVSARSDGIDAICLPHRQQSDEETAPPGGRTHAVRLLRRAFVAGDAHTFRDVVRALKQHIQTGTISVREAMQAAMRAKRIGTPGESITYAETLMDRLRDDCERQYRMEQRKAARPFGDAPLRRPASVTHPSRPMMAKQRIARSAHADVQLSLDLRRPDEPSRRVF